MKDSELSAFWDRIRPYAARDKFATGTVNTRTISTATSTGGASTSALAALQAAFNAHQGLDYVAAHVTGDPTVNERREYWSRDFGFVFDGTTDDSNALQRMLDTVGAAGGGIVHVSPKTYTGSMYYNKTISCYWDNMDVRFHGTPMISGATGCIRIMGSQDEYTRRVDLAAMKLRSSSTVNGSSQTVLPLSVSDSTLLEAGTIIVQAGDKIVVRGQNDISGKAIDKDTTFVYAVTRQSATQYSIVCTDELDYGFDATYPSSEWPPDLTTGTTIYIVRYASLVADLPAGSWEATFDTVTGFSVGDVIQIGDSRTEHDYNASAIKGSGLPYANPAALELVRIIQINTSTKLIGFDRATVRAYVHGSTYHGGIARYVAIRNSHLSGARITYNALQTSTSYNALQQTFAVECSIHDNRVEGLVVTLNGTTHVYDPLYGRASHGIRTSYGLDCTVYGNVILDCAASDSGKGYGATDYYSTGTRIFNNTISGCRHNILLQLATNGQYYGNTLRNHLISSFDTHGVNSDGAHCFGNTFTQANGVTSDSTQASAIRIGNTSHTCGDHNIIVEDNIIVYAGGASDQAMDFIAASSNVTFRNNTIYDANIGIKYTLNSSQITPVQTASNIVIDGNRFVSCVDRPLKIQAQPTYDNTNSNGKIDKLTIINNVDDGNNRHYEVVGVAGITNVTIAGNHVINNVNTAGRFGVLISDVVNCEIYNNNLTGCNKGISLTNVTALARVVGNIVLGLIDGTPAQYWYVDGTGNTSAVFLLNSTDTGVQPTGTSQWTTTGSDIYYNTGKVGIGNATPAAALDIVKDPTNITGYYGQLFIAPASNNQDAAITLRTTESTDRSWALIAGSGAPNMNFRIYDVTAAADRLNIDTSGNVGIGFTAPTASLEIMRGSGADGALKIHGTTYASFFNYSTAEDTYIRGGKASAIVHINDGNIGDVALVEGGGKVGIGTASPTQALHIVGNLENRYASNTRYAVGLQPLSALSALYSYDYTGSAYTDLVLDAATIALRPSANAALQMKVDASGNMSVAGNLAVGGNLGAWTGVSFNANWADYGSSDAACRYRKVGDIVYIEGQAARSSGSGTTIFNLPSGYRPVRDQPFGGIDTNSATTGGRIVVNSAGAVTLIEPTFASGAIGYVTLSGIFFSTL